MNAYSLVLVLVLKYANYFKTNGFTLKLLLRRYVSAFSQFVGNAEQWIAENGFFLQHVLFHFVSSSLIFWKILKILIKQIWNKFFLHNLQSNTGW